MGAYDELATTGRAGGHTGALLRRLVTAVADAGSFVPPDPHPDWSAAAVDGIVVGLLGEHGTGLLLTAWARATDDESLTGVLGDEVRHHLEQAATGWSVPVLADRLAHAVLPGAPRLALVGHRWGRPGQGAWAGTGADRARVHAALRTVSVLPGPGGGRAAVATVPLLRGLVHAALGVSGGSMTATELAELIAPRLATGGRPVPRPVLMDGVGESVSPLLDGPEPGLVVRDTAEELWASLSPLERALVPHLGLPVDELAAVVELPGAMAEVAADELVERLRAACADDERAAEVLVRLRALCTERP